jgi:hypothetical protein
MQSAIFFQITKGPSAISNRKENTSTKVCYIDPAKLAYGAGDKKRTPTSSEEEKSLGSNYRSMVSQAAKKISEKARHDASANYPRHTTSGVLSSV